MSCVSCRVQPTTSAAQPSNWNCILRFRALTFLILLQKRVSINISVADIWIHLYDSWAQFVCYCCFQKFFRQWDRRQFLVVFCTKVTMWPPAPKLVSETSKPTQYYILMVVINFKWLTDHFCVNAGHGGHELRWDHRIQFWVSLKPLRRIQIPTK